MPALNRHNEEEWRRLRRQLELSDGFWLGFLFTSAPAVASEFRSRVQGFLKHKAKRFRLLRPETPDELIELLSHLLAPEVEHEGCIWVEALRVDPLGTEDGPWITAWDSFLLRLNELRERLRRRLPGGLLLVAPRTVKPRVREAAPDLWSIRGPVLELTGERSVWREELKSQGMEVAEATTRPSQRERTSKPRPASTDLPPEEQEAKAAELLRGAEGLLAGDRPEEAVTEAVKAVALLRRLPEPDGLDLAEALWTLARARVAEGDLATAELDLDEALALRDDETDRKWLERLDLRGELALRRQDLSTAEQVYEQALHLCRVRLAARSHRELALRDVSVGLNKVGDVQSSQGDELEALTSYEESLRLSRRLLAEYGESAERLRDVSVGLARMGDVRRTQGDESGALASYEESLRLSRRLLSEYGESAERLRDVSMSLEGLATVRYQQGDTPNAVELLREAVELSERIIAEYGETPARRADVKHDRQKLAELEEALTARVPES